MIILDILLMREMVRSPIKLGGPLVAIYPTLDRYIYIILPTQVDVKCPLSGWILHRHLTKIRDRRGVSRYKDPHT